MVCWAHPDKSYETLEFMVQTTCTILKKLGITYRVVLLRATDMPLTATKAYDIECPIGNEWREVATISNCEQLQTERTKTKVRIGETKRFVHCLNGSALAVGRTMAALMEKYYDNQSNSIKIQRNHFKTFVICAETAGE